MLNITCLNRDMVIDILFNIKSRGDKAISQILIYLTANIKEGQLGQLGQKYNFNPCPYSLGTSEGQKLGQITSIVIALCPSCPKGLEVVNGR